MRHLAPPSRRGGRADLTIQRYLKRSARPGRSETHCNMRLTSLEAARCRACASRPAAPIFKVTLHFLDRRSASSSKEGLKGFSRSQAGSVTQHLYDGFKSPVVHSVCIRNLTGRSNFAKCERNNY